MTPTTTSRTGSLLALALAGALLSGCSSQDSEATPAPAASQPATSTSAPEPSAEPAGGVALQDVPQLAALTEEWALGAGVAVLDLMG